MSLALASRKAALLAPWLRNPLWAAARAVPSLDLRFADSKSLTDAVSGQSLITFTRASDATFVNSQGVLTTASSNVPRFDHNPTTGESLGLLIEEQRSNLLLNSGTLSTQSVTVTAVAHTLHFTGTGTITLSGVSTAGPLVGTGTGEANRVSLTFTPTAGSLTLTVSGTVTNAQLEVGSFRSSYIPTTGTAATRSADVASITGSAFSGFYRQDQGTFYVESQTLMSASVPGLFTATASGITNNRIDMRLPAQSFVSSGGSVVANIVSGPALSTGTLYKAALGVQLDNFTRTTNNSALASDTSGAMPVGINQIEIGNIEAGTFKLNGHIRRLVYWGQRLPNEVLQRITL